MDEVYGKYRGTDYFEFVESEAGALRGAAVRARLERCQEFIPDESESKKGSEMDLKQYASSGHFLTKEDVPKPKKATISETSMFRFDNGDEKLVLHFKEDIKPLACNKTNARFLIEHFGIDKTEDLTGCVIVLWTDPKVEMGGKQVGGLRIREPRKPQPEPPPEEQDDCPF